MTEAAPPERFGRLGPQPAEALARLMPMREAIGITRIADITGLDVVGIPVVQVVRPLSLSNAVSQGKGGTLTQAAVSAILEAAEACYAERMAHFDAVVATARSLGIPRHRFEHHLSDGAAVDWHDQEISWVEADNLVDGDRHMVPLELVHTAYTVPPQCHDGTFTASTTGLAAGFVETDAIVHGILECIERDAIARANRTHGFFQDRRLDPETIDDPTVCTLLEILRTKGFLVGLWQAPSPVAVPVICCHLLENKPGEWAILPHPAVGSSANLDPGAAIANAIYEAAQSRLAGISGARDDMTRAFYPKYPDWQKIAAHRRLIAEGHRGVRYRALVEQDADRSGDRLSVLLATLTDCGVRVVDVVRIDTTPLVGLAVARVIVPALMPLMEQ